MQVNYLSVFFSVFEFMNVVSLLGLQVVKLIKTSGLLAHPCPLLSLSELDI